MGEKQNPRERAAIQIALKIIVYISMVTQFASIFFEEYIWNIPTFPTMREDGLILMALGLTAFITAMTPMKTNWRAGYSKGQNTKLVTTGIYKYSRSRNPAFVGFDLLYIGCALAFPNPANIGVTLASITFFHLQILGEEKFLADTFGQKYTDYKAKVLRYFGVCGQAWRS